MTADGWPPLVPGRAPEGARHTPYLLTLLSFTCTRPRPRAALNFSESGGTFGSHSVRLCHHGLTLGLYMPSLGWVSLRHHWHLWPDHPLLLGGHPVHWVMFNSTPPLASTHEMPTSIPLPQWQQAKTSPDVVRRPLKEKPPLLRPIWEIHKGSVGPHRMSVSATNGSPLGLYPHQQISADSWLLQAARIPVLWGRPYC